MNLVRVLRGRLLEPGSASLLTVVPTPSLCAGLVYPPSEVAHLLGGWGEKQAHEIAHAWIGGQLRIGRRRQAKGSGTGSLSGGPADTAVDTDVWAREGLTHLYGVLALDVARAQSFMQVRLAPPCRSVLPRHHRLTTPIARATPRHATA